MNKRGFTLIELLAVIVILAIIALIATPIVMNVIENSRKGAAERSADNYIDAVEVSVGTERIDGNILEGEYTIQLDGNLCPTSGCGVNDADKVKIDMSGDKPSSGNVYIENGTVTKSSVVKIDDYLVHYNDKDSLTASKKICAPVASATAGNVPEGNFKLGDEYVCELGDGIVRTFFVLEDGDDPTLTKGDFTGQHYWNNYIGTAGEGEVSLIMSQNIGDMITWCESGNNNSCNGDKAKTYLQSQTSNWTADEIISIDLPTYAQIYAVNNKSNFPLTHWLSLNLVANNGTSTGLPHGYWTLTSDNLGSWDAYGIFISGTKSLLTNKGVNVSDIAGVRPVITISKERLTS